MIVASAGLPRAQKLEDLRHRMTGPTFSATVQGKHNVSNRDSRFRKTDAQTIHGAKPICEAPALLYLEKSELTLHHLFSRTSQSGSAKGTPNAPPSVVTIMKLFTPRSASSIGIHRKMRNPRPLRPISSYKKGGGKGCRERCFLRRHGDDGAACMM